MAIKLYDDAVYNKILKWVKDPNAKILKPEETERVFRLKADESNDKPIELPLIAISRDKNITIINTNKQPKTFNGIKLQTGEKECIEMSVIPISITYQIDIYTRLLIEADEYLRDFIFKLINNPNVKAIGEYNGVAFAHISTVHLEDEVTDNSDIKERLFSDQFTRYTIRFSIDDAYLFSLPIKENAQIDMFEIDVLNKDNTGYDSVEIIDINK